MSIDRRDFIKIAGITALSGAGGFSVLDKMLGEGLIEASETATEATSKKRWGMVIDVSKFKTEEDYKKVIEACHRTHNVPDLGNPKDEIKWIWTDTFEHTFPGQETDYMAESMKHKPFLMLCNHCEKPPCVRVCPTKATFKRPDGIVMMDYHRCIGCRFCMAACPFGARSFNWKDPRPALKSVNAEYPTRTKGVVEKCNFCADRIDKGLLPACVEASNGAMLFGDLNDPDSEVRKALGSHYAIRRKNELGTRPSVYYIIGGKENA
ncbi:MAG: 4Fe-4S dicluster domain-containing protein [Nitrospirae bacterium]|nr:4Fe-4S dicluster domain-containing protein [Nitrospirota bacterium]